MFEVEIKASLGKSTIGDVTEKAVELGFTYDRTLREVDTYFNGNDRDFRETDEALRIRSCERWREDVTGTGCQEKESEAFITYKGPKLDDVSGTRKEYEVSVDSGDTAGQLISSLGYVEMFTVDKKRREFTAEENGMKITLCADEVTGLEPHVELEVLASTENEKDDALRRLFDILDELGIPRENVTRKSYLEMLLTAGR